MLTVGRTFHFVLDHSRLSQVIAAERSIALFSYVWRGYGDPHVTRPVNFSFIFEVQSFYYSTQYN